MGAAEERRSTTNRVIEIDGRVVGHIASFDLEGHREVTYWIGREDWAAALPRGLYKSSCSWRQPVLFTLRLERQRRVDSCVDEVRFSCGGRRARVRSWAQRGNGRGRAPTRSMTPTALGCISALARAQSGVNTPAPSEGARAGARVSDQRRPGGARAPRLCRRRSMGDSAGCEARRAGNPGEARTSRLPGGCTQSSSVCTGNSPAGSAAEAVHGRAKECADRGR